MDTGETGRRKKKKAINEMYCMSIILTQTTVALQRQGNGRGYGIECAAVIDPLQKCKARNKKKSKKERRKRVVCVCGWVNDAGDDNHDGKNDGIDDGRRLGGREMKEGRGDVRLSPKLEVLALALKITTEMIKPLNKMAD